MVFTQKFIEERLLHFAIKFITVNLKAHFFNMQRITFVTSSRNKYNPPTMFSFDNYNIPKLFHFLTCKTAFSSKITFHGRSQKTHGNFVNLKTWDL